VESALAVVLRYVELSQQARKLGTQDRWDRVAALWHENVEIRVADGRTGGRQWRVTARGRSEAVGRLSRSEVAAPHLETKTVRAFASEDEGLVVVEQLSYLASEEARAVGVPVCHVFEVEDGQILRQSVYRNES
jgi:ketosteroid isomerase-like protein